MLSKFNELSDTQKEIVKLIPVNLPKNQLNDLKKILNIFIKSLLKRKNEKLSCDENSKEYKLFIESLLKKASKTMNRSIFFE